MRVIEKFQSCHISFSRRGKTNDKIIEARMPLRNPCEKQKRFD